jgi:predicted TIM-barrel fold metal-dependent hydrolase
LGLPDGAGWADYLSVRAELGASASQRLLRAAGLTELWVDSGIGADLVSLTDLARLAGAPVREVVRLETLAESVLDPPARFVDAFETLLARRTAEAVAVKSIAAYRGGLAVPDRPPAEAEVVTAAERCVRAGGRVADPVVVAHVLWRAVARRLPIQLHTGFGDADAGLLGANPALLQPFCAAHETPVVLLHCYPYHREAGWLAHLYPHVSVDVGLTLNHVGPRATAVLAEFIELTPPGQLVYSSDAYGLAELYYTGAMQFRHALAELGIDPADLGGPRPD